MIESLTALMVHSGAAWVLVLLIGLSVLSLGAALERAYAFRSVASDIDFLVPELRRKLRAVDREGARALASSSPGMAAKVLAAGLADADLGPDAAEEAMAAAIGLERRRLERGLLFLGTVGNNAPFVGLLGTVIGIVGAFEELGRPAASAASALAPERVMSTIAEALVATAVGLVVAIPAVAIFNYFQGRVAAAVADSETLGHVLLAHLRGAAVESTSRTVPNYTLARAAE